MRYLFVFLFVFLTPLFVKAETNITYLECEEEIYFKIKKRNILFFSFDKVTLYIEDRVKTYLQNTKFSPDIIEGEYTAGKSIDKFKIYPKLLKLEWLRIDITKLSKWQRDRKDLFAVKSSNLETHLGSADKKTPRIFHKFLKCDKIDKLN